MNNFLDFGSIEPKTVIAFFGLFHISVGALSVGLATVVTVFQILGYRSKNRYYDLFAKRSQLFHVCIYNVGTINAIGLVFALSGLYPQFWAQIFVHFFWTLMIEEFLFLLLATTVTFHYFFWEHMWGHKKLHIFLGALLTPLFFLQFYIINGMGGFMLTPGFGEAEVSLSLGILGWDKGVFYNPSFLMLQAHRTFANVSYAAFFICGWCGVRAYLTKDEQKTKYYEDNGRLSFYTAAACFLSLPVIGYFYSHVLKFEANDAFNNLMFGQGDVVVGGVDLWWLKHIIVAMMVGAVLAYFRKQHKSTPNSNLPMPMIYGIGGFYLMFYMAMGMIMTWAFFWWTFAFGVGGWILITHLVNYHGGSGRAVFLTMGILAFCTVLLGGWAREASRPRFVERISHYDPVYVPLERQPFLMVDVDAEKVEKLIEMTAALPKADDPAVLIQKRCVRCHGLDRIRNYQKDDWDRIVKVMMIYGTKLNNEEVELVINHLKEGKPY